MLDLSVTADGSHSIFSRHFGAFYHSVHGAIQETNVVFIDAGFRQKAKSDVNSISILELGFGSGLNAFMTFLESKHLETSINYTSYELYPVDLETVNQLNYPEILQALEYQQVLKQMHETANKTLEIKLSDHCNFNFTLINADFFEIKGNDRFDVIYFDAFAPEVQPELWTETFLKNMYNVLKADGILVTYCAKGSFKRALKNSGFQIESLPGPKGKREMTRAIKR